MSEFTKQELDFLKANGNKRAAKLWRATWDAKKFPRPSCDARSSMKSFMEATYIKQAWKAQAKPDASDDDAADDDDDDDDEDDNKKNNVNNNVKSSVSDAKAPPSASAFKRACLASNDKYCD